MAKMKLWLKVVSAALLVVAAVAAANYISTQRHVPSVMSADGRNKGLSVLAYHRWLVSPDDIVFDIRSAGPSVSALDVMRVLFDFADELQTRQFDRVYLAYQGTPKFYLKGDYFAEIGQDQSDQNRLYSLRRLPQNVMALEGERAFGVWHGGVLGLTNKQMEDLNTFNATWWRSAAFADLW